MKKQIHALASAVAAMTMAAAAQALPVYGQGTWETTLLGRDINGIAVAGSDPGAVFLYDTTLNVTWLRDTTVLTTITVIPLVVETLTWATAESRAAGYSIGGYGAWRLPTTLQPDATCELNGSGDGIFSYGFGCSGSEMGHLWYVELGNVDRVPMSNTGDFQGLRPSAYWSNQNELHPTLAWRFSFDNGWQDNAFPDSYAWATIVRDGDVLAVPEPETAVLMLAGMGMFAVAKLHRKRNRS